MNWRLAAHCVMGVGALLLADRSAATLAAEPTAHEPQFDRKDLWPNLCGKEAFVSQKWEKGRVLVWAQPGQKGVAGGRGGLDSGDGANWTIDGQPGSGPVTIDQTTDVVLPDAQKPYTVTPHRTGRLKVRHLTIGRNATLGQAGYGLHGNVWIRQGGRLGAHTGGVLFGGSEHVFVRNDNKLKPADLGGGGDGWRASNVPLAHYLGIAKTRGASLEFLGDNASSDELVVHEGTVIIGPDSSLHSGYTSTSIVGPEAVLELQSGAVYGRCAETWMGVDLMVQGELRAGSPQRPLTRDASLRLTLAQYKRANEDDRRKIPYDDAYSVVVHRTGKVRVYSTDPDTSRLVFTSAGQKIKLGFLGDVRLEGVLFDHVRRGGIHMADPAAASQWKHVAYGTNNEAAPDALVAPYDSQADATLRLHERDNYRGRVPR